jgi:hypothetical protein
MYSSIIDAPKCKKNASDHSQWIENNANFRKNAREKNTHKLRRGHTVRQWCARFLSEFSIDQANPGWVRIQLLSGIKTMMLIYIVIREKKAAIRGDQRGARCLSVSFTV